MTSSAVTDRPSEAGAPTTARDSPATAPTTGRHAQRLGVTNRMGPHASPAEIFLAMAALAALAVGILALAVNAWPWTATVDVAVSYLTVSWLLARGLNR